MANLDLKPPPKSFHVSSQLQLCAPKTMERKITLARTYVSKPHFCRFVAELPLNSRDFTDMQPWAEYATGIEEEEDAAPDFFDCNCNSCTR